ncbi:flavin-containing monooxygenase FMO GS-OX-like 4 [Papaver somniferum]|uniref:flavin-containing monooxygenase FMO GS-OX-like 4 n=1 Tax=Papaver somniferum TaxID=3469 RepID=UPI000E702616|nr:flavin-containing monooxygenase FMO GS-OX-like 4 [Papaver somniferum]XP_026445559.1 flavin-containing monooxygenase FMO GS-OX-like 4 [Papaver somniferum]XP_026445560.1 flavin-containing monooxygenase FMO GS-OX-like 4 [Papaver somniferum]
MKSSNLMSSKKVAVIGAGASGLVASRELRREGHVPVVFERNNNVGGTWIYNPEVESDPLGVDPSRTIVQSSVYDSLRTNLPRESMGFRDYPFVVVEEMMMIKDEKKETSSRTGDNRRFPGHREVLNYLQDFANHFELIELIRFETEVSHVSLLDDQEGEKERKWAVKYKRRSSSSPPAFVVDEEVFDAVVVCNGHYTEPLIAEIPGIDTWPGKQIHSHNYRVPDPFRDQVVLLVGNSSSGEDLSRDIAGVAKEVHIASKYLTNGIPTKQLGYDNIWLHSMIKSSHEDGTIVFQDGTSVLVDVILHCTGYKYTFPFLEINNIVTVDDNRVGPLYKHVFSPLLAPGLSFIGLIWKGTPYPIFELQSKWVAGVLSGRILLPSQEEMMLEVEDFYLKLEAAAVPKRYTHNTLDYQFEYSDWLAGECGFPLSEEWRKQMFEAVVKKRRTNLEAYRDEWEDYNHLIVQAQEDFRHHVQIKLADNEQLL